MGLVLQQGENILKNIHLSEPIIFYITNLYSCFTMKSKVYLDESHDETLFFKVQSGSRENEVHDVCFDKDNGWICTCEQYYYRKKFCKHMKLAQEYYKSFYQIMDNSAFNFK